MLKKYLSHTQQAVLQVVAIALLGFMLAAGPGLLYHIWDSSEIVRTKDEAYGRQIDRIVGEKNAEIQNREKQIDKLNARNEQLATIIEHRLPLIVDQAAENVEKLDRLSGQVDSAVTQSKRAAATASRAASQAGQAVKKAKEPVGSIRIKQQPVWREPKCYMGRDLYGDPCK